MQSNFHLTGIDQRSGFIQVKDLDINILDRVTKITWSNKTLSDQFSYTTTFNTSDIHNMIENLGHGLKMHDGISLQTSIFKTANNIIGNGHLQLYHNPSISPFNVSVGLITDKIQVYFVCELGAFNSFIAQYWKAKEYIN